MSFQTIFNIQQSMSVNNRRTVGQMYSRSGQITIAQYLTTVPWMFTINPHNYLYYPQVRNVIQAIDNLDRQLTETVTFNNSNLFWFTDYRGDASTTPTTIQINTQPAANATSLVLKTLPAMSAVLPLFRAGDFIMVGGYTYKITADVLRGAGSTVTVSIHRPVIGVPAVDSPVSCGVNCTFTVVAEQCPTYTLTPMTNGAFVNWDDSFVFREYIP